MKELSRDSKAESGKEARAFVVSGAIESVCQHCGFPVLPKPEGCKNPCSNCGFMYPLGDCSD